MSRALVARVKTHDYAGHRTKGKSMRTPAGATPAQSGIANVLLIAVLAMLVPHLIAHTLGNAATLDVTIPAAFLVVVAILAGLHLRNGHRVPPAALGAALLLAAAQTLPLWWGSMVGDPLMLGDLVNVAAKPVGFLLFVGLFLRASIALRELVCLTQRFTLVVFAVAAYGFAVGLAAIAGIGLGVSSYAVDYSSFMANRNQFGMLLFLGLASLLLARAMRGPRKSDIAIGLGLLVSLALTMSRGSLLGAALLLGIVLFFRKPPVAALFIAPTLAITVVLLSSHSSIRQYVTHFFIRPDVGLAGRDELWAIGLGLAAERPLQGWGSFVGTAEAENRGMGQGQLHSFWLEQLLDWGVFGLVSLLAVFAIVWTRAYRRAPQRVRHVLLGAGAGAVAMGTFESIAVLSVGYVDVVWTIALLTIPVLLSRVDWDAPPIILGAGSDTSQHVRRPGLVDHHAVR
jgi:O-antigen ligase